MNDEEPPPNKNKLPIEATLNLSLPDDLLVSILARVSRLYYPTLSLVSKHFRSLLTSSELYQTRSLLGCTENFLYACLLSDRNPQYWFMVGRRPNRSDNRKKNKSSEYVLVKIPIPHSPHGSDLVVVGSNIYHIGGPTYGSPSSSVSILDCMSHRWLEAPSMQVERKYSSTSFLNGKIYVTGGCYNDYNPSNWMEVFDIKNKTWEPMWCPGGRLLYNYDCGDRTNNLVVDGKLYIIADKGVVYNPKDGSWNSLGPEIDLGWKSFSSCVIENVLYHYYYDKGIKWYDTKVRSWRTLNGMEKLPKLPRYALNGMEKLPKILRYAKLADYGGKMAFIWVKCVDPGGGGCYPKFMIWCAVIALEKRNNEEIWGTVEWSDAVLPHPITIENVRVYVATVNV